MTFTELVTELQSRRPFAFVRYGDGEISCMAGAAGFNCNQELYTREFAALLRESWHKEQPVNFVRAVQPLVLDMRYDLLQSAFCECEKYYLQGWEPGELKQFPSADILHDANLAGELYPLVKELKNHPLVTVGPELVVQWAARELGGAGIICPGNGKAFWSRHGIIDRIRELAAQSPVTQTVNGVSLKPSNPVFLFSAGMAAKVIIGEVWPDIHARGGSIIDCGSIWDCYCIGPTRGQYAKMTSETKRRNLNGAN